MREQGLYRRLRVLDGEQRAHTSVDHRSVVNLSSNNYLGLTTHPRLRERAAAALAELGVGTGSVRPIAGTMAIHLELERRLAAFKHTEAVVVFQSGFAANAGTVSSILTSSITQASSTARVSVAPPSKCFRTAMSTRHAAFSKRCRAVSALC